MNQQYETDYYGWVLDQANLLKIQEFSKLDMQHLIEEIESLAGSERSRLKSHLEVHLMHMLKKKYQPRPDTKSWDISIKKSSLKAQDTLSENPSLKPELKQILKKAYSYARNDAAIETGLEEDVFPEECPWKLQDIFPDLEPKYW